MTSEMSLIEEVRIVIELRRGVEPETIRRQLYKLTNMRALLVLIL